MLADDVVKAYDGMIAAGVNPGLFSEFAIAVRNCIGAAYVNNQPNTIDYPLPDGSLILVQITPGTNPTFDVVAQTHSDMGEAGPKASPKDKK